MLIPEEEDSKEISQFSVISLLSVEGTIFFSTVAKWLDDFFCKNGITWTAL